MIDLDVELVEHARVGDLGSAERLLSLGASVNAYGGRALLWACENGHVDVVKLLLEYEADVHTSDDWALRWASSNGHVDVVKLLLEHRADVHVRDDEALRWASQNGCVGVVSLLLNVGANVSKIDWGLDVPRSLSSMSIEEVIERFTAIQIAKELEA